MIKLLVLALAPAMLAGADTIEAPAESVGEEISESQDVSSEIAGEGENEEIISFDWVEWAKG